MWFVFGSKTKIERARGETFPCSVCHSVQVYTELRHQNYFTLFFIPLIATDSPDKLQGIECCGCGRQFGSGVLLGQSSEMALYENRQSASFDKHEDLQTTKACANCGRENSVHTKVCPRCETRLTS